MTTQAADDVTAIRHSMEYELGFAACMKNAVRQTPDGCLDVGAWLQGWDEAKRLKPKGE